MNSTYFCISYTKPWVSFLNQFVSLRAIELHMKDEQDVHRNVHGKYEKEKLKMLNTL